MNILIEAFYDFIKFPKTSYVENLVANKTGWEEGQNRRHLGSKQSTLID